jgi:hypothetical protein
VLQVASLIALSLVKVQVICVRHWRTIRILLQMRKVPCALQVLRLLMRSVEQSCLLKVALRRISVSLILPHH